MIFAGFHCTKFGWNRCSTLDKMQLLIFCKLGLKKPIHAPPQICIFLDLTPQMRSVSHRDPERHFLARNHVICEVQIVKIGPPV